MEKIIYEKANVYSADVELIQIHLASVLSIPDHAVMLRQDIVSSIVSGQLSYYRTLLYYKFCHFSGGRNLINGPNAITNVQAYGVANHMFKLNVIGSHAILAILGK